MKKQRHDNYDREACPVEASLEIFGGKWKGIILFHLLEETLRFNELQRVCGSVTQRMLTKQLRDLEDHGLINRKVYPEVPPKVEYSLTEIGKTLRPIILELKAWGEKYAKKIVYEKDPKLQINQDMPC